MSKFDHFVRVIDNCLYKIFYALPFAIPLVNYIRTTQLYAWCDKNFAQEYWYYIDLQAWVLENFVDESEIKK